MHQVYILHSEKLNRFYTGYTANLLERLDFHQNSESRKFTYNAKDWTLFLIIDCKTKQQGLQIEKHIKSIKYIKSKIYIANLMKYPEMIEKLKTKFPSEG